MAVFVSISVLGALVWLAGSPGLASRLLEVDLPNLVPDSTTFSLFFVPVACSLLALASGFVFPSGFWLWGIALALHAPFTEALTIHWMYQDGLALPAADGRVEIIRYGIFVAGLIAFAAFCYTVLSAFGMGLRYLTS